MIFLQQQQEPHSHAGLGWVYLGGEEDGGAYRSHPRLRLYVHTLLGFSLDGISPPVKWLDSDLGGESITNQ